MTILAEFDGLTLRSVDTLADLKQLSQWIDADQTHRGIFVPHDFMSGRLAADPRSSCYALEDEQGVIFYIRLSRAARVRIQFGPQEGRAQQKRVTRGLINGMAFLESTLGRAGCEEWIFDTESPQLKNLAERLLGFAESTHEMVRAIPEPGKQMEVA
jgi:hypothetical protein